MSKKLTPESLISIIIPTYNAGKNIDACLDSIFCQVTFPIEVIILDGGSTDEILSQISLYNHPAIKCIAEPDKGIYDAMNKGIAASSGNWLYFMGADDRLLPGFNELAGKLEDANSVYYGNSVPFYENGNTHPYGLLTGEFSPYRLSKYCMNHQSIIYPVKAFQPHRYNLKYRVAADYAFNLRLWGDNKFRKNFYPIDVVRYNMGGFSAGNRDVAFYKDKSSLVRKFMGWKIFLRYIIRAIKDTIKGREGV